MNPSEIETALKTAFRECLARGYALSDRQQDLILETVLARLFPEVDPEGNPLEELSPEQYQALLEFIADQERNNCSWKASLLNDWLRDQDSGSVQFIREEYGFGWLNRVQPRHWQERPAFLSIGDRIEVCNALWEWVQEGSPCGPEWFEAQVIGLSSPSDPETCRVRFDNGQELDIPGIYQWNRCNWRFPPRRVRA